MNINLLPPDYFKGISTLLDGIDIVHLWMTGDCLLRRLIDNMESFEFVWDHTTDAVWPSATLSSMKRLRIAAFKVTEDHEAFKIRRIDLSVLHKGLESLELRIPAQKLDSFAELPASLTSMKCLLSRPWSIDSYWPLPSSLTVLELGFFAGDALTLPPALVPPNLTSLALNFPIRLEEPPTSWPRQLKTLSLNIEGTRSLDNLHQLLATSLTELSLQFTFYKPTPSHFMNMPQSIVREFKTLWSRSLPELSRLEHLQVHFTGTNLPIHAYPGPELLPSSVTSLNFAHLTHFISEGDVFHERYALNPPNLQLLIINGDHVTIRLPGVNPTDFSNLIKPKETLKGLKFVHGFPPELALLMPPKLTSLDVSSYGTMPSSEVIELPPMLEVLIWKANIFTSFSLALPPSLTILKTSRCQFDLGPSSLFRFPPHLTWLEMYFPNLPALSILPKGLKILRLDDIELPSQGQSIAADMVSYAFPDFWDAQLPSCLEKLQVISFHSAHLPFLRLASKAHNLKKLSLATRREPSPVLPELLDKLGASIMEEPTNPLEFLSGSIRSLRLSACAINPNWLSGLPTTIKRLKICEVNDYAPLTSRHVDMLHLELTKITLHLELVSWTRTSFTRFDPRTKLSISFFTPSGISTGSISKMSEPGYTIAPIRD